MSDFWTDERIEVLKTHWREDMSTRKIGEILGCTKNAVISKAKRVGLRQHAKASPAFSDKVKTHIMSAVKYGETPAAAARQIGVSRDSARYLIERVGAEVVNNAPIPQTYGCRWPHGHPGEPGFHFCTAPTTKDKFNNSYCAEHFARAYRSRTEDGKGWVSEI